MVIRNIAFVPATPRQVDYIREVLLPKYLVHPNHQSRLLETIEQGRLAKDVASQTIDWIKRQPLRPAEVVVPTEQETIDRMQAEMENYDGEAAGYGTPASPSPIHTVTQSANPWPSAVDSIAPGRYAIEWYDGDESDGRTVVKFYKVDKPTEGRWAGRTFVNVQASDEFYPVRNPSTRQEILTLIARDPKAAMLRYGQELGHCGHCGRTLTDETSRALGIGPVCRGKLGW